MPTQVFIRNQEGRVWGPLEPQSVQLLIEGGLLEPPLEVSLNGLDFSAPELLPEFSMAVPQEVWAGSGPRKPARPAPPVLTPSEGFTIATPVAPVTPVAAAPTPAATPPATPIGSSGEIPPEGDLAQTSAVQLYGWAASGDVTGLFSLSLPDRKLELHFRKGNPERVESSHPQDGLGVFLRQQGLVNDDKLAQAEREKGKFGGELVAALFGLGILNPGSAFAQLGQRATALLLQAFLASSGRFTFQPKELPAHQAMPLGNRWAVLSDVVRRMPAVELSRRLADVWNNPVMRSSGRIQVTDLKLSAVETRAFSRVDGTRSPAQLIQDFPAEGDNFSRIVFMLRELELVSFARVTQATKAPPSPPPPPVAPPPVAAKPAAPPRNVAPAKPVAAIPKVTAPTTPTPPPPSAPAAPRLSPEAELSELKARAEKLPKQSYFEILGVSESADSASIKAAYFKLAKQLHPDTVPPDAPLELAKLKANVFAAVGEAYHVVGEDASRAAYTADLKSGALEKVDVRAILAAEEKFQRACVLFKARKYGEALVLFEECIAANQEEGEFYAWRGYARYVTAVDKKKGNAEAQKDLTESLKRNPRCAPAHYFLGMIARANGDNKAARRHFQNTVDLEPHHVDAQRELRLLEKSR